MTTYHTSVRTFSRAKNQSAIAAAAYRGALLLTDPISGTSYDYRARFGVLRVRCMVPDGSPFWADDPQALWAAAEAAEKRKDSTVARNFQIALPSALDENQRWDLILDISKQLIDRFGFAIQMSHHRPSEEGGNFYANLFATTRKMDPCGLSAKTRELDGRINGKEQVEWIRGMVAEEINRHLELAGTTDGIDHHSDFQKKLSVLRQKTLPAAWEAIPFDQMLNRYRQEARLLDIPEGHTHEKALGELESLKVKAAGEHSVGEQPSGAKDNRLIGGASANIGD